MGKFALYVIDEMGFYLELLCCAETITELKSEMADLDYIPKDSVLAYYLK